jgi:putative ABC transport system permease protein
VVSYAKPLPLAGAAEDTVIVGTGVARKLNLCAAARRPRLSPGKGAHRQRRCRAADDIAALTAVEKASPQPAGENRIEMLAATARGAPTWPASM